MHKYRLPVCIFIALCWVAIVTWQVLEHRQTVAHINEGQQSHALSIANSLAVVIRAQRRFGAVSQNRLVEALQDLTKSHDLHGIALLNPAGETVAAGGRPIPDNLANLTPESEIREDSHLLVAALVKLGADKLPPSRHRSNHQWTAEEEAKAAAAILWNPDEIRARLEEEKKDSEAASPMPDPPPAPEAGTPPPAPPSDETKGKLPSSEEGEDGKENRRRRSHNRWEGMRNMHPFWQSPEKYRELYEKQGLHMMVLMLDDAPAAKIRRQDFILRIGISVVALAAAIGLILAWFSASRSDQLLIRLTQARAANTYLRELNLAAAGLAHETRNPLNLVRGHTQLAANDPGISKESRQRLDLAVQEVDRITARLNEFIDYSRPRDPKLTPVDLTVLLDDVIRTLDTDREDKDVTITIKGTTPEVLADEPMIRQVLFNLVLNAIQAVPEKGMITVELTAKEETTTVSVIDDGPGVPSGKAEEIFKPYVTLTQQGSGLGLPVAQQIAIAHNWDLSYTRLDNQTCFSLSSIQHHHS